jgi:hypothetical protein
MTRDFLLFLKNNANGLVYAPGTGEAMNIGDAWKSKAETAHARAEKACGLEADHKSDQAGEEWQKLFGSFIPK